MRRRLGSEFALVERPLEPFRDLPPPLENLIASVRRRPTQPRIAAQEDSLLLLFLVVVAALSPPPPSFVVAVVGCVRICCRVLPSLAFFHSATWKGMLLRVVVLTD
jgi:hypothetical protein